MEVSLEILPDFSQTWASERRPRRLDVGLWDKCEVSTVSGDVGYRCVSGHDAEIAGQPPLTQGGRGPLTYSITSSARPSIASDIARPSALAVLRLMISSTFVTC